VVVAFGIYAQSYPQQWWISHVRSLGRRNSAVDETIITAGDRLKNIFAGKAGRGYDRYD
jgi:hypothetical protein